MSGQKWNLDVVQSEIVREYLIKNGGIDRLVKSNTESWQVRFSDASFTYYKSGTLFSTSSRGSDPAVDEAWAFVNLLIGGSKYISSTKEFLIGFDEAGKGEVLGHTVLAGVFFPKDLMNKLEKAIGVSDTKKSHAFEYWNDVYVKIEKLTTEGVEIFVEQIPPGSVDKFNYNKLLDVTYQRILNQISHSKDLRNARIVIDDYGVGETLNRYLRALENQGAEIVVATSSEDSYIEAKVASLVAKRYSQMALHNIRNSQEFKVNGMNIGSGNAGDTVTVAWLNAWKSTGKSWPWFVKSSFKTIREIDGIGDVSKQTPPLNTKLLSSDFLEGFNNGNLSIRSLELICPFCGARLKNLKLIFNHVDGQPVTQLRCIGCDQALPDAGATLRYYCGYILPDTNAIVRRVLSKDLKKSAVFEGFNVLLSPVVRSECDKKDNAKKELEEMQSLFAEGRLNIKTIGELRDYYEFSNVERDEFIVKNCLDTNSILVCGDINMQTFAIGRGVFTVNL